MLPALAVKAGVKFAAKHPAARKALMIGVGLSMLASPMGVIVLLMLAFGGGTAAAAAPSSVPGISPIALAAYSAAVAQVTQYVPKCQGMTWEILAAEAQVESSQMAGHNIAQDGTVTPPIYGPLLDGTDGNELIRDTGHDPLDGDSSFMRAAGPFQFLPTTWTSVRAQMGVALGDPQNINDASLTAAVYLCGNGRNLTEPAQLKAAIYQYNNADWYVSEVESWITTFSSQGSAPGASSKGQIVIAAAEKWLGTPYSYGGGNPSGPTLGECDWSVGGGILNGTCYGSSTVGFDCSGLTLYAYAQAGVALPHNSQQQWDQAPVKFPASEGLSALQPGDLVFFAFDPSDPDVSSTNVHHVGIYLGGGMMIDSPTTGAFVREEPVWMDQYSGGAQWW